MVKSTKIKYKVGDIIRIPLQDDLYAHAKIFDDGDLGVYDFWSKEHESTDVICTHPIAFFVYSTDSAIKDGSWPIIGHEAFKSREDSYSPPVATCYDRDSNTWTMGRPRVNHKGDGKFVTAEEIQGLDVMSVCHEPRLAIEIIVDRLINGNHERYKVRKS